MRKLIFAFIMACMTISGSEKIPQALFQLLHVMEVPHDGTLSSIVTATQARWIRPSGKERWEVSDLPLETKEKVIEFAEELGFFQESVPKYREYEYGVLLGATVFRMQKRIETLIHLWEKGVRFRKIIVLTAERPLDPSIEALTEICETEGEAAEVLWKLAPIPEKMSLLPTTFFSTPMITTPSGVRRPTTGDTLSLWLASNPSVGRCLFISNQPYCLYQDAVVKERMPASFAVETVGEGTDGRKQNAAVILDTIARWLYQLHKLELKRCPNEG